MTNPLNELLDGIEDLSMWIQGKKKTPAQKVKKQVQKGAQKVEDVAHTVAHKAKALAKEINHFVDDLVQEPSEGEKMAREFQKRADNLNHQIDQALRHTSSIGKEVKAALTMLKDAIVNGLKKLGSFFKNLVSTPLAAVSHGPTLTTHRHKIDPNVAKQKAKFESHNQHAKHPEGHRKILPNKGGNR